jgi:hypothetical protein
MSRSSYFTRKLYVLIVALSAIFVLPSSRPLQIERTIGLRLGAACSKCVDCANGAQMASVVEISRRGRPGNALARGPSGSPANHRSPLRT